MERRAIAIQGTVQGVGFRPFVYGLARQLDLRGFVRNETSGVQIEVEGEQIKLDQFLAQLTTRPPPLARIDRLICEDRPPRGDADFQIESSLSRPAGTVVISPDVGVCDDCLRELFDPRDRRYRYPFLNCTNCGPRLTITCSAPYDRARTTMAGFPMCSACRAEYEDPGDRRFHAQPTACPRCGPKLVAFAANGTEVTVEDPLDWFVDALRAGRIGAVKGLGGYHLACDATNESTVAELRSRKRREEKPFAVMVPDLAAAEVLCEIEDSERQLLCSGRRPIVLLPRRAQRGLANAVAPGTPRLGVMLPYTPLHHLLMKAVGGPLVMTSGNRSDEPIAFQEPDVFERLRGIADLFLSHDRPIHVRCDDSVTRVIGGIESPIRRSRGDAPQPIPLPIKCPAGILAVGGQVKATFALGRARHAILSHHLGDLDHFEATRAFENDVTLYEKLFNTRVEWIAHDLHPDYASTRYANRRSAAGAARRVAVQHHHAHMASCMAEHGLPNQPVIGVAFDGTGLGTDGAIWGGEFLVGDYCHFRRAAHLRYVGMPGGEIAIREPWRMAMAHLREAGTACPPLEARLRPEQIRTVRVMLERRFNSPPTSSAGRLFDAVAALIGVRDRVSQEGQAAMELEWLAYRPEAAAEDVIYAFDISDASGPSQADRSEPLVIDTRPLIRQIVTDLTDGVAASRIARRFHTTVSQIICTVCGLIRTRTGVDQVVLSGGVFCNAMLAQDAENRLRLDGFIVYRHRLVPPNDGGLSLGQLAVAAAQLAHAGICGDSR